MKIDELQSNFECIDKLICIKSPNKAIQYALVNSKEKDFLGIIGTHYLGDSISKIPNFYKKSNCQILDFYKIFEWL